MEYKKGSAIVVILLILALGIAGTIYITKKKNNPTPETNNISDMYPSVIDSSSETNQNQSSNNSSTNVSTTSQPQVTQTQTNTNTSISGQDSCFISPHTGTGWSFGSIQTIELLNPPQYDSHCSNGFSLYNENDNLIGYLMVEPRTGEVSGQTSWNYFVSETIPSISCGTGAGDDPSTTSWIPSGQYKIRFSETDIINGVGTSSCESDVFTIQ